MSSDRREAISDPIRQGHVTIGTAKVQLTDDTRPRFKGVLIKALAANSGTVFIGGYNVAASGDAAGMPIDASESLYIPAEDLSKVFLIADASSQVVAWLAM